MKDKIRKLLGRRLSITLLLSFGALLFGVLLFWGLMKHQSVLCEAPLSSDISSSDSVESSWGNKALSSRTDSSLDSELSPKEEPELMDRQSDRGDANKSDSQHDIPGNLNVNNKDSHMIDVPYLTQQGICPSGCEVVSATMMLRYYGYSITIHNFIDEYLDMETFYRSDGVLYGPDPKKAFAGDPLDEFSCGCYAPVIEKSLNRILSSDLTAVDTTGTTLEELEKLYIDNDIPVAIWASVNMQPTREGNVWITEEGDVIQWITPEHCLVLVGYDESEYYFNDPYENKGLVSYDKELVEARFQELGKQSVVIIPT